MSSEEPLAVKEPVLDYSWDKFPVDFRVSKSLRYVSCLLSCFSCLYIFKNFDQLKYEAIA